MVFPNGLELELDGILEVLLRPLLPIDGATSRRLNKVVNLRIIISSMFQRSKVLVKEIIRCLRFFRRILGFGVDIGGPPALLKENGIGFHCGLDFLEESVASVSFLGIGLECDTVTVLKLWPSLSLSSYVIIDYVFSYLVHPQSEELAYC